MKKRKKFLPILSCLIVLGLSACGSPKTEELRLKGIEQLEKGKYQEALVSFEEALKSGKGKVSKEQFDILSYSVEAKYMLGDYEGAKESLDILRQVDGDRETYRKLQERIDAKLLLKEASEALNENRISDAREILDRAKAAGLENDRDLKFNEIVYLEKTAKWEEAYAAMEDFVKNYQGDADAERELAFLKERAEELSQNPLLSGKQSLSGESQESAAAESTESAENLTPDAVNSAQSSAGN